jgi:DNA-binding NarL/FixJ family response regulator
MSTCVRRAIKNAAVRHNRVDDSRNFERQFLLRTILVIEDHVLVREGLMATVRKLSSNVEVLGVGDVIQAVAMLNQHDVDLVLLDLMLPGSDGEAFLPVLRARFPSVPVVVLSAKDDANTVAEVMEMGASGFVSKGSTGAELLQALKVVQAGELFVSPSVRDAALRIARRRQEQGDQSHFQGLTPTQARVLSLLCGGNSNDQIGALMGIGRGTVKVHVSAVIRALGVSSRAEAVAKWNRIPR